MKANLNESIRIKLSDKGWRQYAEYYLISDNQLDRTKLYEDKDGYFPIQIHEFMRVFGKLGALLPEYVDMNFHINDHNVAEDKENGNGTDMSQLRNMLGPIFNYLAAAENADMQLSNLDVGSAQYIIDSAFKARSEIKEWLKSLNK